MKNWLQITSGRGPQECCWVVFQIVKTIALEAKKLKIHCELLEAVEGDVKQTFKSALLKLDGQDLEGFSKSWVGTVQWVGKSPFRPNHKRKNWFAGVERFDPPEDIQLSDKEIKFETMRSSGPGGQHADKSDTAVRATHLPTKLNAIAREERSQYLNKKLALARLLALIEEDQNKKKEDNQKDKWNSHNELERGNHDLNFPSGSVE